MIMHTVAECFCHAGLDEFKISPTDLFRIYESGGMASRLYIEGQIMSGKTMTRASEKFGTYKPSESGEQKARAAQNNNMLAKFGEESYFNEFRRAFVHDQSGSKRPQFFLRPDNLDDLASKSRTNQVRKLRRLEKRQLWLQNILMALTGFVCNFRFFNPFRSYADQTRFKGRTKPKATEPARLVPHEKRRKRRAS